MPVPEVGLMESLNRELRERCVADRAERTGGEVGTKTDLLREDQTALLPLSKQAFEPNPDQPGLRRRLASCKR